MWPLHARSKDEYVRLIEGYVSRQEIEPLRETLHQAFDDYRQEEDFAAWCASVAYGVELPEAATFQARFLEKFPLSLQPVQVDWAEKLVWEGNLDDGANEARAYLHRIEEAGLQTLFEQYDVIRDAISRAFLILTSVYTEVGARRYSCRVLEYALVLQLDPYWQQRYRAEHARLCEELRELRYKQLDDLWEGFYAGGENLDGLLELCRKCRLPLLGKRLETMRRMFDENSEYRPGDEEFFQLVYQTDKGAFVLA